MSSLTDVEKRYLEKILNMQTGYVLDYTDAKFAGFFKRYKIDIHSRKYQIYGTSKAKKMRAFWDQESDTTVATVLSEMLSSYVAYCKLNEIDLDQSSLEKCQAIVTRLFGDQVHSSTAETLDSFLNQEFILPNIYKLPVETQVAEIIEARIEEAKKVMTVNAPLAVIFLCGSVLEAVLLGAAQKNPNKFNSEKCSPKTREGKVKPFHEWTLSQLIDVAYSVGLLKLDIKKFSHVLRDFRNFIHPYEQMKSRFIPDHYTAKVCFQVLKAALADLAGER